MFTHSTCFFGLGRMLACALFLAFSLTALQAQPMDKWKMHDENRPQPPVVQSGYQLGDLPVPPPPSDAVVLFDGTDLAKWRGNKDMPAPWKVENGYMEVVDKSGGIRTAEGFGDCQLHVEWAAPEVVRGKGQNRGNSGVYLMSKYEIQVLDSYNNKTYPDGQAASIYGEFPPLVNASRPPGHWQSYDVIFHAPRFDSSGALLKPARLTVFHNNVLVQNDVTLPGPTENRLPYVAHPDRMPLYLQEHGAPVRYRNIWLRELNPYPEPHPSEQ